MASLSISNFLSIKKADIKLKRVNIFIGPQAQGKSIISKLVYFFKELPSSIVEAAVEDKDKRQFDALCRDRFVNIFPTYAWEKTQFLIVYDNSFHAIFIENQRVGNTYKFTIKYTASINKALSVGRKLGRAEVVFDSELNSVSRVRAGIGEIRKSIVGVLYKDSSWPRAEQTIYIPAGRSFFSKLQKSLFSFISSNIPIDYFLKAFGSIYELAREPSFVRQVLRDRPKSVAKLVEDLLCGKYISIKGQDWIVTDSSRVSLSNSSSGQQEVLPMALILSTWPYAGANIYKRSFIIEEPEAHLFPIAQGQVVSLIAEAYNAPSHGDFVITTHSPYILTALNNLIQASNAQISLGVSNSEEVYDIVPRNQLVNFDDVTAYMVDKGSVKAILDYEYRLIQAESIDAVSEYFSERFEQLIALEMKVSGESE